MGQPLEAMQAAQEGLQYTTPDQEASVQLMWLMRDASKLLGMYSRGQLHRTKLKSYMLEILRGLMAPVLLSCF